MAPTKIHHLLHTLWTKAVGTSSYSKKEWKELEHQVEDLIANNPILAKVEKLKGAAKDVDRLLPHRHEERCLVHNDPECGYCTCGYEEAKAFRAALRDL